MSVYVKITGMDQETEKMLRELLRTSRENNKMLKELARAQRRARFFSILKTVITIGLLLGAYYLVAPFLDNLINAYSGLTEQFHKFQEIGNNFRF
jgi:hypothetical protein